MEIVKKRSKSGKDSYRIKGYFRNDRVRKRFKRLEDAEAYLADLYASGEKVLAPVLLKNDCLLKDAIKRFCCFKNPKGDPTLGKDLKLHFEKLWIFLTNIEGIQYLDEVKLIHLENFITTQQRLDLTHSYINRMFATYKSFFNKCVDWELINESPARKLKKLQEDPKEIEVCTRQEIDLILQHTPGEARRVLGFIAETGARPIDVSRITYDDVDFENSMVRFVSRKGRLNAKWSPVSDKAMEYLGAKRKSGYVFLSPKGNKVTADWLNNVFVKVRNSLGLNPRLTVYSLRHTFANDLVDQNVHINDVKILMRHAKIETTLRYTHRKINHLKDVVNRRSQLLKAV